MKAKSASKPPENPQAAAVKRILNIAQLVRTRGTPEEAEEAIRWEKQLKSRLEEIEQKTEQTMKDAA